jgi:putative alpha-1,2-mannosidase
MTVDGKAWNRPWLAAHMVMTGGTIDETLVTRSSSDWGTARADAPPSYGS